MDPSPKTKSFVLTRSNEIRGSEELRDNSLNFLLRCNYNVKHLGRIPTFYKEHKEEQIAFDELKSLYNYEDGADTILFNN